MIKSLTMLGLVGLVALFSGCRSKSHPELYNPGDIPAWRTVDSDPTLRSTEDLPRVVLNTNRGAITIELFEQQAPISTANFLQYVNDGFYNGLLFHRVIPGFMIQGGGLNAEFSEPETRAAIANEAGNGLRNTRGTVAMARTDDVASATAQFFINLVDNSFLNGDGVTGGYAVFGRVVQGMDVVDQIAAVETATREGMADVPVEPVVIESARVIRQ